MSTLKTNNVQVGQSVTATNNFTIYQPSTPDGTVRIGVGNSGATTADVASISSSGDFKFNSGYGSIATAYAARAWVNFNGTGTVAIRSSGNVSSITDNGAGDYTVNFTTAMPDANYAWSATGSDTGSLRRTFAPYISAPTTSAFRFLVTDNASNQVDVVYNSVTIFR